MPTVGRTRVRFDSDGFVEERAINELYRPIPAKKQQIMGTWRQEYGGGRLEDYVGCCLLEEENERRDLLKEMSQDLEVKKYVFASWIKFTDRNGAPMKKTIFIDDEEN